jgi:glycosyltransferase involved in cell wall biosynthesis
MDNNMKIFFSIAIPTYGYNGKGSEFLEFSFDKLKNQTFKNFEVVISDHSIDNTIKDICDKWSSDLDINYIRNEEGRGIISPNINVAMKHCHGEWIKILFQDDFLFDSDSLQKQHDFIINNPKTHWFVTRFMHSNDGHTFYNMYFPRWHEMIWTGDNTMGCPSGITVKNKNLIFFDEGLNWLMDCDYYTKMKNKFGVPSILEDITVVNRTWGNRLTDTIQEDLKIKEFNILKSRYA